LYDRPPNSWDPETDSAATPLPEDAPLGVIVACPPGAGGVVDVPEQPERVTASTRTTISERLAIENLINIPPCSALSDVVTGR